MILLESGHTLNTFDPYNSLQIVDEDITISPLIRKEKPPGFRAVFLAYSDGTCYSNHSVTIQNQPEALAAEGVWK